MGSALQLDGAPAAAATRSYVRLRIGELALAVEASDVDEIADYNEPVPLPKAPPHLLGLMLLRDRAVPLVALDIFVGISTHRVRRTRVVVVARDNMRVGIPCDQVSCVREIGQTALLPLSSSLAQGIHPYVSHEHFSEAGRELILDLRTFLAAARVRKR